MTKEIVSLHIGQAGNQIGFSIWELILAEHGLRPDGFMQDQFLNQDPGINVFLKQCNEHNYTPRGLFIDMDKTVIDQLKTGSYRMLYHPNQLIAGNDDSASNFARAYYTQGRVLYQRIFDEFRKQMEACDRIQALLLFRALAGGCGSGVAALMIEVIQEYLKVPRIEIPIHPSPHFDSCVVAPYNALLGEHFIMDEIEVGLLIDNESLFDIATGQFDIQRPTMTSINRIMAQVVSTMTSSTRFSNQLFNDFGLYLTNLVPYPRIHFPMVSYSPMVSNSQLCHDSCTVSEITRSLFEPNNQLVKCDIFSGRMMCCSLLYRGLLSPHEVHQALAEIKLSRRIRFVDWCPTGFKVGIVDQPPTIIPDSMMPTGMIKNAIMLSNNSVVSSVWHRLAQRFHRLHSKRSFVHWYVGEGLEETEFCEALYNLATLAKDYEEVSIDTKFLEAAADKAAMMNMEEGAETQLGGETGEGERMGSATNTGVTNQSSDSGDGSSDSIEEASLNQSNTRLSRPQADSCSSTNSISCFRQRPGFKHRSTSGSSSFSPQRVLWRLSRALMMPYARTNISAPLLAVAPPDSDYHAASLQSQSGRTLSPDEAPPSPIRPPMVPTRCHTSSPSTSCSPNHSLGSCYYTPTPKKRSLRLVSNNRYNSENDCSHFQRNENGPLQLTKIESEYVVQRE